MTGTFAPVLTDKQRSVYADILSQAVTGELIGMANYAAMCQLFDDPENQIDAVAHADNERGHAAAFRNTARDLGVTAIENLAAPYWHRVRIAFMDHVARRDIIACLVIQEVMLECFAVSMYHAVAAVAPEPIRSTFRDIGDEEEGHVDHAIAELQAALQADRDGFERKVEGLHDEVMTILAEMVAAKDTVPTCGLCHGECVKGALKEVGLDRTTMRGQALNYYLRILDRVGVRGERSLAWVARLPV